jgi:hypothetical protein
VSSFLDICFECDALMYPGSLLTSTSHPSTTKLHEI